MIWDGEEEAEWHDAVSGDEAGEGSPSDDAAARRKDEAGAPSPSNVDDPSNPNCHLINFDTKCPLQQPRRKGLRFVSIQKLGDHFCSTKEMAYEQFEVLYECRNQIREKYGLDWNSWWPYNVQTQCHDLLKAHFKTTHDQAWLKWKSSRQIGSAYNTFCWQLYGGIQWVRMFFAFGIVDYQMVVIYDKLWTKQVLEKSGMYRGGPTEAKDEEEAGTSEKAGAPSHSGKGDKAGAQTRSGNKSVNAGDGKERSGIFCGHQGSARRQLKNMLAQVSVEREAFCETVMQNKPIKWGKKGAKGRVATGYIRWGSWRWHQQHAWWHQQHAWWVPALRAFLTVGEFDTKIRELKAQYEIQGQELVKKKADDQGSACDRAIKLIAKSMGLTRIPDHRVFHV